MDYCILALSVIGNWVYHLQSVLSLLKCTESIDTSSDFNPSITQAALCFAVSSAYSFQDSHSFKATFSLSCSRWLPETWKRVYWARSQKHDNRQSRVSEMASLRISLPASWLR